MTNEQTAKKQWLIKQMANEQTAKKQWLIKQMANEQTAGNFCKDTD